MGRNKNRKSSKKTSDPKEDMWAEDKKLRELDLEKYNIDLKKFHAQLAPLGLKVNTMGTDGNCMFRAIADQLEGDESKH